MIEPGRRRVALRDPGARRAGARAPPGPGLVERGEARPRPRPDVAGPPPTPAALLALHRGDPEQAAAHAERGPRPRRRVAAVQAARGRTVAARRGGRARAEPRRRPPCSRAPSRSSPTRARPASATRPRASCAAWAAACLAARGAGARRGLQEPQRARARGRRAGRRGAHQPRDRRRAVPLGEDGREPPLQGVRQARGVLARGGRRAGGACARDLSRRTPRVIVQGGPPWLSGGWGSAGAFLGMPTMTADTSPGPSRPGASKPTSTISSAPPSA